MAETLATKENGAALLERVVVGGDLSRLSAQDRMTYYTRVCDSVGLNPLTRPFEYITLQGKMTLYAKRDATDQLRKIHGVSVKIVSRERLEDVYVVTAQATDKGGRMDESIGAVSLGNLRGEALANAIMKAETKSKRRVTLSICGLGLLDETETDSIPGAVVTQGETSTPPAPAAPQVDNGSEKPSYEPFGAITMITKMGGGSFKPADLETYFAPGVRNKTSLDAYSKSNPREYQNAYDLLHRAYIAWKDEHA